MHSGLNGRLGHGNEEDHHLPRVVEALLGKDVRGVACGVQIDTREAVFACLGLTFFLKNST